MAGISAYMLFKLRDLDDNNGFNIATSLQALFFFMIVANFILLGSAGYEMRNDCDYVLTNSTVAANVTTNNFDFVCTERISNSARWMYKLPIWLAYFASGYVVIYLFNLIVTILKGFFKGGNHGK